MPPGILNNGSGFIGDGRPVPPASLRFTEMRRLTSQSVRDLAAHCGAALQGDGSALVRGIASIESAKEGDLVFASDEGKFRQAAASGAAAIVTGEFAQGSTCSKPMLVVQNPKLAFARLAALLLSEDKRDGHDESAQLH